MLLKELRIVSLEKRLRGFVEAAFGCLKGFPVTEGINMLCWTSDTEQGGRFQFTMIVSGKHCICDCLCLLISRKGHGESRLGLLAYVLCMYL